MENSMRDWLHTNRERVLEAWQAEVRLVIPVARPIDSVTLSNSIPRLYNNLLQGSFGSLTDEQIKVSEELGSGHGAQRSRIRGYDLEFVVEEYQILRRVILKIAREHQVLLITDSDAIMDAIGLAVRNATCEFTRIRAHQLTQSKNEAENANEAKSTFLANMSHEIRTPLGAILGYADLLKDTHIQSERDTYIRIIARQGKALSSLVDNILDLSKIEAGHLSVRLVDFKLFELIEEIVEMFLEDCKTKGLLLTVVFDPECPNLIVSDPNRLSQILKNLIGNAVKFTERGTVKVSVRRAGKKLSFTIEDTGIGMTRKEADLLFKPFSQVDATMTRKYGGTGLGLVLSRQLAKALGGDVTLLKYSDQGCTFLATIEAAAASAALIEKVRMDAILDSRIKILLVEDSIDTQDYIKTMLERKGMTVAVANDGQEGVEMIHAGSYDLVIMDVQMPNLNGYQATRLLRGEGYKKAIVALTAHARPEDRTKSLAAGCDGHLTKPVDQRMLFDMIHDLHIHSGLNAEP